MKLNQIKIKIAQLQNKLKTEQAELTAINNELKLLKTSNRQNKMYEEGLVSLTQLQQQRNVSYQNALAKKTSTENKLAQTQQEITAQI